VRRPVLLPGLAIYPRNGPAPLPDDKRFMDRLYIASTARAYLENLSRRRTRGVHCPRTLSRRELEERLEALLQGAGTDALQKLRDDAKRTALSIGLEAEYKILDGLIGTLLGTRDLSLNAPVAIARAKGLPYDPKRLDLFQRLFEALSLTDTPKREIATSGTALPFFETYFSNFIEGTEFLVDEAFEIVFEGKIPENRPADAHDILGTYQLTANVQEMTTCPQTSDELIYILKRRHALLMHGRPEVNPGKFKVISNQAGSTLFVTPELVEGTLRKGFQWLQGLQTPFQRAVYMMFLIAEVHPFADGNGRCARIMMNAELVSAGEARIIIPTIFRSHYLSSLKALTHQSKTEPLICALSFAQEYTALVDWSDFKLAHQTLLKTHAFVDSSTADAVGLRLLLPLNSS